MDRINRILAVIESVCIVTLMTAAGIGTLAVIIG